MNVRVVVAWALCRPWTAADSLFTVRQLGLCASRGATGNRCALQPSEPHRMQGMHPAPNRLLIPGQPVGNLGAAFAIHQEQNTMVALAQPGIVRAAKGCPHLVWRNCSMRDGQYGPVLPYQSVCALYLLVIPD